MQALSAYKGATKVDFWTKRVENVIPDAMDLQTAGKPYKKLQWTTHDRDEKYAKSTGSIRPLEMRDEEFAGRFAIRLRKLITGHGLKWLRLLHNTNAVPVIGTQFGLPARLELSTALHHLPSDFVIYLTGMTQDAEAQTNIFPVLSHILVK